MRRPLLVFSLLSSLLLACGGEDGATDPSPAPAGQGGNSGSAGKAGASGKSGQGGAAGASQGGSAGAGGAGSGQAGSGGAGAAGAGPGGASGGGQGGAGQAGSAAGGAAGSGAGQAGAAGAAAGAAGQAGSSAGGAAGAGGAGAGGASAGQAGSGAGGAGQAGAAGSGGACKAPDVLIALDRTLTMHFTPEGAEPTDAPAYKSSKWSQAIAGIEGLVSPPTDAQIRFGLELWPRDPGGGACITLAERVTNTKLATNPPCEDGEIAVPVGENKGEQIKALLDPTSTLICSTTPTAKALQSAESYLAQIVESDREQYVVLVTDGADWDKTCPDPSPLLQVQKLAASGIKTFIVGFSSELASSTGVGVSFLNDMACAGQTAKGFPATCKQVNGGYEALDKEAAPLFLQADNGGQLSSALQSVAGSLCCGCQKTCQPPDMLIALDRTLTMHFTPEGAEPTDAPAYKSSKWSQAIAGIEGLVAPPRDSEFRFGLELWPRDPGGGACITLAERVTNTKLATNPPCEGGEIAVPAGLNKGSDIQALLDPTTTHLCSSTPTGEALITASKFLTGNGAPGRAQYVVLVTDGADWDKTCPDPSPLLQVRKLAASGIKTFIVGFSSELASSTGVGVDFLNRMACAGQTAPDFATNCKLVEGGYDAVNPGGPLLFLTAQSGEQLTSALTQATAELGCKL